MICNRRKKTNTLVKKTLKIKKKALRNNKRPAKANQTRSFRYPLKKLALQGILRKKKFYSVMKKLAGLSEF